MVIFGAFYKKKKILFRQQKTSKNYICHTLTLDKRSLLTRVMVEKILDLNLKFDSILSDISKSIHLAFMFNFCIQDPGEGLRPTKIQFQSNLGKKNQEKPGRKSPDYLSQSLIF